MERPTKSALAGLSHFGLRSATRQQQKACGVAHSPLREADGALVNNWYVLALSKELKRDLPLARVVYDTPMVAFRDERGKVAVLLDRCAHRGAHLSTGKCASGGLRCSYHGWKFNAHGKLEEVPSEGISDSEAQKKRLALRKWSVPAFPAIEQDGVIWVWPGDSRFKTSAPPWRFPYCGHKSWSQYFMITDFENEVTNLVENFMDVPHTVFVHEKWSRRRRLLRVPIAIDVGAGRVKVTYQQPGDSIGFWKRVINPAGEAMVHTDEFIFPNLTRVDYSFGQHGFVINSQCTPITRFQTRVYTWIAFNMGSGLTHLLKPFMRFYTRQVIEQDVDIMKDQGDNLKHFGYGEFKSTQADELHLAIERLRSLGAQGAGSTLKQSYAREREIWI